MASDANSTINTLIETLKDGEAGFQTAAADVKDVGVKTTFTELSRQRGQMAAELSSYSGKATDPETPTGSISAAAHRGWMNIKSALGGGEKAILNEAERGEDVAVSEFQKALGADLPADVKQIVQRQYTQVKSAHDRVKQMRDSWK